MALEQRISELVAKQRSYFNSGATQSYAARRQTLQKLKTALLAHKMELNAALQQDLGKPEFEACLTETGFCLHELNETLRKLKGWMKPKRVWTSLLAQPASSRIHYAPLGVNLIVVPFNYPVYLTFSPLIAALAAGNTAVLKSSELTPACNEVIGRVLAEAFDPAQVAYVTGALEESEALLRQKWDHIFFTGSPRVGAIVMAAAAKNLTPVTLELGGKSPCIVHADAKLDIAVNRIVRGKFINAGQTCVAPDYVLVQKSIKEAFLGKLKERIFACYGEDAAASPDYGRIINDKHFERLTRLIDPDQVVVGGHSDAAGRYIAPTVMHGVSPRDPVMAEEIFGPILPVLEYDSLAEVYQLVGQGPQHPLACYLFSENPRVQQEVIANLQFGGGCINNCVFHLANSYLPFGGVGESGIGSYHGVAGFERFSHKKGVMKSATWSDNPLMYAPYGNKIGILRKVMRHL